MRYFKLPDLGEGLQEAELIEWHVKAGDTVAVDDILLVVETAKAMVEIPSPQAGIIAQCFGAEGDFIHIGEPLVEYANVAEDDTGTVVGEINQADSDQDDEDFFIIGAAETQPNKQTSTEPGTSRFGGEILRGPRRAMAKSINATQVHSASVTLCEDADIDHWPDDTDITIRLCRAVAAAVEQQPIVNAWFDEQHLTLAPQQQIDLALAVDTDQGLFAPVLRDIANRDDKSLRAGLNALRQDVKERKIPARELQGATIALSNFGTLSRSSQLPPAAATPHR